MIRRAQSLASLLAQVNAIAPHRSKISDGWLGDAAHQGRVSDHNPDASGIVRAIDITDDPGGGMDALWLREALRKGRDPRLKYVISEGQMFSAYATSAHPAWTWRTYSGTNAHHQHVHVSVIAGTAGDRAGSWALARDLGSAVRPPITPDVPEDDDMTPAEYRTAFVQLMGEAADRSTPTGRTLGDYLTRILGPSVAAQTWAVAWGRDDRRQTAADRLALAAQALDPAALAAAIAANLPASGGSQADVETAVRNVLGSLNDKES